MVIQPHVVQVHGQNGPPAPRQDRDVAWRERGVADSSVPVSRQGRWVLSGRGRDVADHGSASPAMQGRPHLPATVQGPLILFVLRIYIVHSIWNIELKTGNEIIIYTLQLRAACRRPEDIPR